MDDKAETKTVSLPGRLWAALDAHAVGTIGDRSSYLRKIVTDDLALAGKLPGSISAENARLAAELSREACGAQLVAKHLKRAALALGRKEVLA